MKKLLMPGIICLLTLLVLPALASQPETPDGSLKMNFSGKKEVIFSHSAHKREACSACHHPVDGEDSYAKCSYGGCHDVKGTDDKSVHSYNLAIHKKRNNKRQSCMSCHEKIAAGDRAKKKELTSCAGSRCHP